MVQHAVSEPQARFVSTQSRRPSSKSRARRMIVDMNTRQWGRHPVTSATDKACFVNETPVPKRAVHERFSDPRQGEEMIMTRYKWTVIGAGPAGIAAVGRLLDHGIAPKEIAWVDPGFTAGDLGDKWRAVHSNTVVSLFLDYLNASPSFRFDEAPPFKLTEVDPGETCLLDLIADPLVWISEHLRQRVAAFRTMGTGLYLHNRQWTVETDQGAITSEKVILAVGASAKKLAYPDLVEIPLEVALDPE